MARPLLVFGTVAAVLAFSKLHATVHGYDYTDSFRFAWSLAYIVLLVVAAYGAGLPELPRTRRSSILTALASTASAAIGISVVQFVAGSAVLPRFVILGTSAVLIPLHPSLCHPGPGRDRPRRRA